jgi:Transglycosylase SLT domain/SPOR domain
MQIRSTVVASAALFLLFAHSVIAGETEGTAGGDETVAESVCRQIEGAARVQSLPVTFLTRLIWKESSFQLNATSPAGAQGVAQFMPTTADQRGLKDPFDPEKAIPKATELLVELKLRFGNLGLAAAAYNAGPSRVDKWLAGSASLPAETRDFVSAITGHAVEDWTGDKATPAMTDDALFPASSCVQEIARIGRTAPEQLANSPFRAPWGVQLTGSFSKTAALGAYARARNKFPQLLGNIEPMVIGGRMRGRGFSPFYRVRAPSDTREAAETLCKSILRAGGACVVLHS